MAQIDKIILNGTQYDLPSGGGGGGTSYTAGAGIDITGNVISNTREQRVLIDEDDDTGLHSGFIVKSPHWKETKYTQGAEYYFYGGSGAFLPNDGADPTVQSGFLSTWKEMKIVEMMDGEGNVFNSFTFNWPSDTVLYINGETVSGETTIYPNDVLKWDNLYTIVLRNYIFGTDGGAVTPLNEYSTSVYFSKWTWQTTNTAYVVHNGSETQLADSASVSTLVSNSVGAGMVNNVGYGKFTKNFNIIGNTNTGVVATGASASSTQSNITLYNNVSRNDQNLTIGFDPTYSQQETVTYYSYRESIDWMNFFQIADGNWGYGETGSFVDKTSGNVYYLDVPVDGLSQLTNGNAITFEAYGEMGTASIAFTVKNGSLVVTGDNDEWYDSMTGNYYHLTEAVGAMVNGTVLYFQDGVYSGHDYVLIQDISNLTSFGILPNPSYAWTYQQVSASITTPYNNTIWNYEGTGTVTYQYANHPEKLNHYIRYAGETGTAVGNRKAYIITDKNISQASYIAALEARITALETALGTINQQLAAI